MDHRKQFIESLFVVDTETTGKDYKTCEVIEVGFVLANPGTAEQTEWTKHAELFKPDEPISPECSAITNISNLLVDGKRSFVDASTEYQEIINSFGDTCVAVAHNAFYDKNVLLRYGVTAKNWLCTLRLSQKLFNDDITVSANNLPYLRYRFGILDPALHEVAAHRADHDALVTAMFLEICLDKMEEDGVIDPTKSYWEQIDAWLNEPIITKTMPFGKHKGKLLTQIPLDYWNWALENMDSLNENAENYDKDFALSVEKALEEMLSDS